MLTPVNNAHRGTLPGTALSTAAVFGRKLRWVGASPEDA